MELLATAPLIRGFDVSVSPSKLTLALLAVMS